MAQQLTQQQLQGLTPYLRNLYARDPGTFNQRFGYMVPQAAPTPQVPQPAAPIGAMPQPAEMPQPQPIRPQASMGVNAALGIGSGSMFQNINANNLNKAQQMMPDWVKQYTAPQQPAPTQAQAPAPAATGPANLLAPEVTPQMQNQIMGQQITNAPQMAMPGLDQGPAQFGKAVTGPQIPAAMPQLPAVSTSRQTAQMAATGSAPALAQAQVPATAALTAQQTNAQRSQQLQQQRAQELQAAQQRFQQQQQDYAAKIQQQRAAQQEAMKKAQKTALTSSLAGAAGSALGRNLGSQFGQNLGLSKGLGGALGGALGGLAGQALGGGKVTGKSALASIGGGLLGYGINSLFGQPQQQASSGGGWGSLLGGLFG